jgi:DNA-binding LytR/AlgR family response regulator
VTDEIPKMTSMKIKCILVEDEAPARDLLISYTNRIPNIQVLEVFENALDAYDFLSENEVDLMITDITMPRLSGIDMIKNLRKKPLIIMISAHANFALDGFDLDVVDFLIKPATFDRFVKSINKVFDLMDNSGIGKINTDDDETEYSVSSIYVKEGTKIIRVDYDEIIAVEGMKDYVKIITKERNITTLMTIKKLEEVILPKTKFIRVHKSFILSIYHIKAIDTGNGVIELRDGSQIPLGHQYKAAFLNKMKPAN